MTITYRAYSFMTHFCSWKLEAEHICICLREINWHSFCIHNNIKFNNVLYLENGALHLSWMMTCMNSQLGMFAGSLAVWVYIVHIVVLVQIFTYVFIFSISFRTCTDWYVQGSWIIGKTNLLFEGKLKKKNLSIN